MSNTDTDIHVLTRAQAMQAKIDRAVIHVRRNPGLTLSNIAELYTVSRETAQKIRKLSREAQ